MERQEVNQEASKLIEKEWDNMAAIFKKTAEVGTCQGSMILYHHTLADKSNKILEVGVGTGRSSQMFSQSFMKQGALYVNTDISDNMIEVFRQNLATTGFEVEHQDVYTEVVPEADQKKIVIMKANNEELPFPDEEFDCYVSNLSLQIVDNPGNQLLEACRVLKSGAKAGFTVWGDESRCRNFTFLQEALAGLGYEFELAPSIASSFKLRDAKKVRENVLEAGFKVCKIFTVNLPFAIEPQEEFLNIMVKPHFERFAKEQEFEDVKKEDLWQKVRDEFYFRYGPESSELPDFEQTVCIATK
ncbi:unnamed protein product [Moneuplotes crassus]|uniref:Methyltransferase type 11 domain-containing protein n=1 Tax=Euplotes crassus TaxID=5936 RepID=A0AAD1XN31_EUPCR|nr:unnamed protein product [Moneuplotes crassus]